VLRTDKGDVECDVVINAAGAWAPQIGRLLGHPALVNPEVHEVIRVKLPKKLGYVVPFVNFYMPGSTGEAVYFRQDGPDSLIAGMHTYGSVPGLFVKDPDNYNPPNGDDYLTTVAEKVYERLKVDDLGFREGWFGLYPLSADGVFQVGPYADDPSVLVVAGLGGVGVTSGAILGALAAEWALLGEPVTVPSAVALLPDRKSLAA
jgi:glycine/D-amino acid oxidase-like deaminating enzyme